MPCTIVSQTFCLSCTRLELVELFPAVVTARLPLERSAHPATQSLLRLGSLSVNSVTDSMHYIYTNCSSGTANRNLIPYASSGASRCASNLQTYEGQCWQLYMMLFSTILKVDVRLLLNFEYFCQLTHFLSRNIRLAGF